MAGSEVVSDKVVGGEGERVEDVEESPGPAPAALRECVLDTARPIAERMRAVFYLRTLGDDFAVGALCDALRRPGTVLYRHEIAYTLGQIRDVAAVPALTAVLEDVSDDAIVRHECAEALGAIGAAESQAVLEKFLDDDRVEVSDTCRIALDSLKWQADAGGSAVAERDASNPFESVDPAPPLPPKASFIASAAASSAAAEAAEAAARAEASAEHKEEESLSEEAKVAAWSALLQDTSQSLFDRYRAMFSLRNANTAESVLALAAALTDDNALFRHEVAYVLGQAARPEAFSALKARLLDKAEHPMVRHEAAEAIGAIGTPDAIDLLRAYLSDPDEIVRESCEVALDAADYWAGDAWAKTE